MCSKEEIYTLPCEHHQDYVNSFLAIETTSDICSVALIQRADTRVLETTQKRVQARELIPMVKRLLDESESPPTGIAVSAGPGSYTGLRIGVASAKGLAWSMGLPLFAVSSLESQAARLKNDLSLNAGVRITSIIRARDDEVFMGRFEVSELGLSRLAPDSPKHIENVAPGTGEFLISHDTDLLEQFSCADSDFQCALTPLSATNLAALLLNQHEVYRVQELSSFEPFYLRDFVAKKAVRSIFDRIPF